MNSKFECFVEISDQRYDIVVQELGLCVKFREIYEKIKQIVKIALKEDINRFTHKFEIFGSNSPNIGSVVTSGDQLVNTLSTIRITEEPNTIDNGLRLTINRAEDYLLNNMTAIEDYKCVVLAIDINWNLKNNDEWGRVRQRMVSRFPQHYFKHKEYFKNLFYQWTEYYAQNYYLNGKLNSQKIFDLLKLVHILDLDKLYDINDIILAKLRSIEKREEFVEYYKKYLISFQQNNGKVNHLSIPSNQSNSEHLINGSIKEELIKNGKEVEEYHYLVVSIFKYWDTTGNKRENWERVTEMYPDASENLFYKWTKFYAQNYFLNGSLETYLQKRFDLLKIVHILDFDKYAIYGKNNNTGQQIQLLSNNPEMKHYFTKHLEKFKSNTFLSNYLKERMGGSSKDTRVRDNKRKQMEQGSRQASVPSVQGPSLKTFLNTQNKRLNSRSAKVDHWLTNQFGP